jgi:hypothetical protein
MCAFVAAVFDVDARRRQMRGVVFATAFETTFQMTVPELGAKNISGFVSS